MAIQDVDDLISQLRQHPEWRAALRREILTEELLSLPQIMRELAEAQRQTLIQVGSLAAAQRKTEDRLGSIEGRLLERDYYDKAYAYFDDALRKIRVLSWSELADLLDQAEERIGREEREQVMEADIILRGRRLTEKGGILPAGGGPGGHRPGRPAPGGQTREDPRSHNREASDPGRGRQVDTP
jgi:hypothetical protein